MPAPLPDVPKSAGEGVPYEDINLLTAAVAELQAGGGAWQQVRYAGGNITITATTNSNLPSVSAITVAAVTGDILEVAVNGLWGAEAPNAFLDVATMVSGSPVNYISGGALQGVAGWVGPSSGFAMPTGTMIYTVQAGDISGGNVVLQLRAWGSSSGKTLFAAPASNYAFTWMARNTGQ